jgi:outer membrane protein assembly factor BamB
MLKKIRRIILGLIATIIVVGAVLRFFFGMQIVLDGGGMPHVRFVESASEQAARIERHRAAQRAQAPLPTQAAQESVVRNQESEESRDSAARVDVAAAKVEASPTAPEAGLNTRLYDGPSFWTDFRGPRRDGSYTGPVNTNWPAAGLTPIWKQPVGGGYASFVIASGRAFTIEQRGPKEVAAAYDVKSGRELWTNTWDAEFTESMGGDGPRATPTWSEGRIFALGATGELRALDERVGRVIWRTNILADSGAGNLPWGMSASPLVLGNAVIVLPGGPDGKSVVAYDRATGKRLWSALGDTQGYAAPMYVTLAGVPQLVIFSATRLIGLSPDGAKELWSYPWATQNGINAAQPLVIGDNRLFLSSSYGTGAAVIELTKNDASFSVREVWRNTRMKNRFASSVLRDGVIYGLDESILAAVDAQTGEQKWKGGRYGYGQLLLAGQHLIVLTEDGDLALVRATPDRHEELSRFHVLEGKTWNVPAIADGYLLVRNLAEMAAFDLRVAR